MAQTGRLDFQVSPMDGPVEQPPFFSQPCRSVRVHSVRALRPCKILRILQALSFQSGAVACLGQAADAGRDFAASVCVEDSDALCLTSLRG